MAAVAVAALVLALTLPAGAGTGDDEARFLELANSSRTEAGLGNLQSLAPLVELARAQAAAMAAAGSLWHSADREAKLPPEWQAYAENVGMAAGAPPDAVHEAFMASAGHRANLLGNYNYVGIGVAYSHDGTLYVVEIFMLAPSGTAAQVHDASAPTYAIPESEPTQVPGPAALPHHDWYFAEGYTGAGFSQTLQILNPGAAPAAAMITYLLPGGWVIEQAVSVPAHSRRDVDVNAAVGPDRDVAAVVTSSAPVVVQRTIAFSYKGQWEGRSTLVGATAPAQAFYFAEGYTGPGFEVYLTLANPAAAPVEVTVAYAFADGAVHEDTHVLPARSRTTLDVNAAVGPDREVAVVVEADAPIVAERPMYFAYGGHWTGGHTSTGMTVPSTRLAFAEGYTGDGFHEYLTLLNPGAAPATVAVSYLVAGGVAATQSVVVGPKSRHTIRVNDVVPDQEVSLDLVADRPIVAERPMYFAFQGRVTGGHNVVGTASPARHWLLPGGDTTSGSHTYLTVANPNGQDAAYTVTFFDAEARVTVRNFTVPGRSRQTLDLAREAGSGRLLGLQLAAEHPVVVEQPTYSEAGAVGGSTSAGMAAG